MSANNILNLNEEIVYLTLAPATSLLLDLPYVPEFVEITNDGAASLFAKGAGVGGTMSVPATTFPARPTTQPGSHIQPGASKTYRFPLLGPAGFQKIALYSTAGTTCSVKIGRGV